MPVSDFRLNRFERVLFGLAVLLAAVLIAVRLGALIFFTILRHPH
jgi:hypothetical protein